MKASRTMSAAELLRSTGHEKLDETTARDVTRFLRNRGLRASPSLFSVLADLGEERWEPGEFDAPGLVVDAARLERARITLGPSRLPALGGAVCVGVVVSCIGLYRSPASALVAAVPALVAVAAVWAWPPAPSGRLPRALPRGALLGVGVTAILVALGVLAVVTARSVADL